MATDPIQLRCTDGFVLGGTLFGGTTPGSRVVIIASALGVPQKFYAPLASYLADAGFSAITFDYRGIGDSRQGPVSGSRIRMEDWGRSDIDAAIDWCSTELKPSRIFLLGHSAGGQLAGLARSSAKLHAMVFTAVSSAYWGHWRGRAKLGMVALMYGLVPALSTGRQFYPAGGFASIPVPAGVTAQWARWARTPGYLYDARHRLDLSGYRQLSIPLLAYQFDDDTYAPQPAHEAILAAYPKAAIKRRIVRASDHGGKLGHFGFFRERHRDTLWRETVDWLRKTG